MIPAEKKQRAFALYCLEVPITEIIKDCGIKTRETIYRWMRKDGWEKKRREVIALSYENDTDKTRERHGKLIKAVMGLFIESLKKNKNEMLKKTTNRDVMEAIKLERLIEGDPSIIISSTSADTVADSLEEKYERLRKQHEAEKRTVRPDGK